MNYSLEEKLAMALFAKLIGQTNLSINTQHVWIHRLQAAFIGIYEPLAGKIRRRLVTALNKLRTCLEIWMAGGGSGGRTQQQG